MCVRSIVLRGQWEGVEARGGTRLSPWNLPQPTSRAAPNTLEFTKKSLDFVWLITYGHHCTPAKVA